MNQYLEHYLETPDVFYFFGLTFGLLVAVYIILFVFSKIKAKRVSPGVRADFLREEFNTLTEMYYELIFSGTSILFFMASYYLIERFLDIEPYVAIWNKYHDFLLLGLIILSCVLNTLLDRVLVRVRHIGNQSRASIRLLGMLYMILIFCYIKFIYENNNYDMFINYFLGLMIGRFVYFDASFKDFINSVRNALKFLPLMLMGLINLSVLSLYGFGTKYLLKHNGVITNVFVAHLFVCVSIFILFHSKVHYLLVGKKSGQKTTESLKRGEVVDSKRSSNSTDNNI